MKLNEPLRQTRILYKNYKMTVRKRLKFRKLYIKIFLIAII